MEGDEGQEPTNTDVESTVVDPHSIDLPPPKSIKRPSLVPPGKMIEEEAAPDTPKELEGAEAATTEMATEGDEEAAPSSDLSVDPDALGDPIDPLPEGPPPSYAPSSPVVTTVRPSRADNRGGTPITVFGAGFVPGCRVFVGEEEQIAEVIDTFTLRFVSPAASGRLPVLVESPSGRRSPESAAIDFVEGPTILRAIPEVGPTEGGVPVILEGRGFADGCTVSLFGVHAPDVVFETTERLRITLPAAGDGPLEGTVSVTLSDGLMGRADGVFRYRRLSPQIEALEPARGWISGGKMIAIRGSDFHAKAAVKIGGKPAPAHFRSSTHIDVEVPPAEDTGPVDVVLENPDRTKAALENGFTYEAVPAPPKIIDVFPKSGLTTGGLTIRIVGDNFTDSVRVRIGELTAVRRVVSSKLIDADVPPRQAPGKVAIEVGLDEVNVRVEEAFTYESPNAPKITGVEPRSGPTAGNTRVVIEGQHFLKGATVRFGGEASKSVVVKNSERIEAVTPPSKSAGLVDIEVSTIETGPGVSPKAFRYEAMLAPTISSVSPNRGTTNGGTELTVEGKNFADGCTVLVAGAPVKTRKISGSVLEAFTPEGDDGKLVDVAVKNPDGQTGTQKRAFQFDARYRS